MARFIGGYLHAVSSMPLPLSKKNPRRLLLQWLFLVDKWSPKAKEVQNSGRSCATKSAWMQADEQSPASSVVTSMA